MRAQHNLPASGEDTDATPFEMMQKMGTAGKAAPGIQKVVFSRTLRVEDYPHVIISDDAARSVTESRAKPGKDIAPFGGGSGRHTTTLVYKG